MAAQRVTLKDLAREAGVSVMTVSYALRGHPRISAARRAAIVALAKARGYRPDPAMSALVNYRQNLRVRKFTGVIACLTFGSTPEAWKEDTYVRRTMEAAGERAQELGFKQEFFWAGDPEHTSGRLDRIFQNRGIEGVLLTRQMVYRSEIPLNLSRYAVVGTSRSLDWTGHDFVTDNHYHAMVRVCQACVERGYTRIGYISVSGLEERLHQRMIGAFLGMKEIFRKSPVRFLPPLGVTDGVAPEVLPWIERTQPDAIITQRAGAVISQLGEKGWQPGRDYGLANPLVLNEDTEISGIQEPMNAIGRTAMDMLHAKLMMREWGAPAFPKAVVLDGPWHEGSTLPWLSKGRQEPVDPSGISA